MLRKVEIINAVIGLMAAAIAFVVWKDHKISLSVALGSVIGGANFWALYIIANGLLGGAGGKLRMALFAMFKFLVLIFVLWALIKFTTVNIVALLIGLFMIIMSVIIGYMFWNERL